MKFLSPIDVDGYISLITQNPGVTPIKFLIQDANGRIAFRTGQELKVDIGADYTSVLKHQVKAGVAINKGQAVYVTSADGTNMIVGLASNATEATSSKTMGLLNATVSANGFADVITEGLLSGLDTSTATVGNPVWLGTNGNLIYGLAAKPYAPAHLVFIGIVTRVNANNGEIFVKVQNGFELDELHDVDLKTTTPINGHLLGFNGTLWVNKTIAGWLGYTPQDAATAITTSNIGSQSVNYANSAAVATNADYANAAGYAENAGTLDNIDSSRIVYGDGDRKSTSQGSMNSYNQYSGFFFENNPTGSPFGDWTNWINIMGNSWDNNYGFQLAHAFHSDQFSVRRVTNGTFYNWRALLDNSNYSGYSNFSGAVYGTIYYDANNTSYYVDPASTSNLNALTLAGTFSAPGYNKTNWDTAYGWGNHALAGYVPQSRTITINGTTQDLSANRSFTVTAVEVDTLQSVTNRGSVTTNSITARNTFRLNKSDGNWGGDLAYDSSINQLYLWNNVSSGYFSIYTNGNERLNISSGGAVTANVDMRAPIFYDSNNTGYYLDPASNGTRAAVLNGNVWITPKSESYGEGVTFDMPSRGTWGGLRWYRNGPAGNFSGNWAFGYFGNESNDDIGFHNGTNGWRLDQSFNMTANGSVRSPIFYDSNDTSYFFDGSSTGDSIRVAGDIAAYYSDERLKDKKGNIENALEKVLSLNGFYYEPNAKAQSLGYKKKLEVGVSAQEVEAILPEIIKDAPIGQGYKTLNYGRLTPLLIEAVKEQQKQIEELKELVNQLINK